MNVKAFVENLFVDYQNNSDMEEFKEELCSNLDERIKYLEKKGMSSKEAFEKATAELGDVTEIASEISNEKRKEVIKEMYMKTRNYMDPKHVIGYVLSGGLFVFGIIIALLAYLNVGPFETDGVYSISNIGIGISTLLPFAIPSICCFVFLGLTQETAKNFPMSWKRALFYTVAVGVILFGLIIFSMMFFVNETELSGALAVLIPFVLPGSLLLAYLILTQKNRNKPWVLEQEQIWMEQFNHDPYTTTKFGLLVGSLWIFAIALFITLGFIIGFQYSWLVFLFTIAIQLLVQAFTMPKETEKNG